MILLHVMGSLWALPHTLIGVLLMLVPHYHGVWFPYVPRRVRRRGLVLHFIAGKIIPEGLSGGFVTGAQTHGNLQWYANEYQWDRGDLVKHETRHTHQEWIFGGVLYPLLYGLSFVVNLVRFKNVTEAYKQIPFERDARRAAGQKV
jgi:hypothetical protein